MASRRKGAGRTRDELATEIVETFRRYQRALDVFDDLAARLMGINRTDARLLDLLEQHGRLSAGELAAGASLTSGAVTGVVDRLEEAGYARRVRDTEDRRRVLVEPTEKAMAAARDIYYSMAAKGDAMMNNYSDDELAVIARFVEDVTEVTEQHAAELLERDAR